MKLGKLKTINEAIEDIAVEDKYQGVMGFVMADAIKKSKESRKRADDVMKDKAKNLPNEDRFAHTKVQATNELKKMHLSEDAFQSFDLRNRGSKNRKYLREDVNINKLVSFLKEAYADLTNNSDAVWHYELGNNLYYVMAAAGNPINYDEEDVEIFARSYDNVSEERLSKLDPQYNAIIVGKIAVNVDSLQSDYDFDWYMPYGEDDGEVWNTEREFYKDENFDYVAKEIMSEYEKMKDLTIEKDGKIINSVKESFKSINGRKPLKESTNSEYSDEYEGFLKYENELRSSLSDAEKKLNSDLLSVWKNYATRHSVEHDDNKKYMVKNNYYVKFFANEFSAKDGYFDFNCFFKVVDEDTDEEIEVIVPCIICENGLYLYEDTIVEGMNVLGIQDIDDILQSLPGNIEKVLLQFADSLMKSTVYFTDTMPTRRQKRNIRIKESFLNETGEVDTKKCADILNNWIDWTEVDETGDVDYAVEQLRSLASEKQITDAEYDYITSNWDDLLMLDTNSELEEGIADDIKKGVKKIAKDIKQGAKDIKQGAKEFAGMYKDYKWQDFKDDVKVGFKDVKDATKDMSRKVKGLLPKKVKVRQFADDFTKETANNLYSWLDKKYDIEVVDNKIAVKDNKDDLTKTLNFIIDDKDVKVKSAKTNGGDRYYTIETSKDFKESYNRRKAQLREGMKFGQSTYEDATNVVKEYFADYSAADAIDSIFDYFKTVNEDEAYKLVYSMAERVEEYVGEELEDSQKYPIESPFEKKEKKDNSVTASQKYPIESPMKKKDSQFVKAEQKAPVGLTENKKLEEDVKIFLDDLSSFVPWSGAVDTWERIKYEGKIDTLNFMLEDMYPEGLSEVELNDLLWHDSDWVLNMVGIEDETEEDTDYEEDEELEESVKPTNKGSQYDVDVSPEEADRLAEGLVKAIEDSAN